ncbi:MAG: hypothetical protein U0802_01905 [Candidatus Binatia bacterium]
MSRAFVVLLALLASAAPAAARDCGIAAEALACVTNDECACGARVADRECGVAARACVAAVGCDEVCHPFGPDLAAVCRAGRCARAPASACPGDCDADAAIGIAELTVGVGIALGRHPLGACDNLDADRDGAVAVDELVRAVNGALGGCTAIAARDPSLRGYYDARLTTGGRSSAALAVVFQSQGQLSFEIDDGACARVYVAGRLVDGRVMLAGEYLITDIFYFVSGAATVASDGGTEVISGTLESEFGSGTVPETFVRRRSPTDDPTRFAGTYDIVFSESPGGSGVPSRTVLRLEVARDGVALAGEGLDRDARGVPLGTIAAGECAVSPQGALRCGAWYLLAAQPPTIPFRLVGVLAADGTGSGEMRSGTDPPTGPYAFGTWTATRVRQ